jgi:hypothetical protein
MAAMAEPDVRAIEVEAWREKIPTLFLVGEETLYTRLHKAGRIIPMSTSTGGGSGSSYDSGGRPSLRIPMKIKAGSLHTQFDPNGGDMGRGTGSVYVDQFLGPVAFSQAYEMTASAQWSTATKDRARVSIKADEAATTLDLFKQALDADFQGDGSGANAVVVTASSAGGSAGPSYSNVTVDNPNQFYDNQIVQVFPSVGGVSRGSFQISFVDGVTNTLYSADALPSFGGATATSDLLMINGASGAAGTSIMGLRAYQVNGSTGTLNGLSRSSYPGRLSTPTVNLSGAAMTEFVGRQITSKIELALGTDNPELAEGIWYMNVDQAAAVENLATQVAITNQQQIKGDSSQDMLKKKTPSTFVGYDIVRSVHALPGRIDFLCLSCWGMGELKAVDLYDVNGQTIFPTIGASGGINASTVAYYVWSGNIFNSNVRAGAYVTSAAIPSGIFG